MMMVRRYAPNYSDVGISRDRYQELLHFCRQYPEWQIQSSSLLGVSAQKYSQSSHAVGNISDPTQQAMLKREAFREKMDVIETAARKAGEEWISVLIRNVCYGVPLSSIDQVSMPTSNRNAYFEIKKKFFIILDQMKK